MNKKLILIIAPLLVIVLGAAGWMFLRPVPAAPVDETTVAGPQYTMAEPFVVNLAGSADVPRFVRVGIALTLSQASAEHFHEAHGNVPASLDGEAQVRDITISSLQTRTAQQLSTTRGRNELKQEIMKRINSSTDLHVLDVFYTDFVVH